MTFCAHNAWANERLYDAAAALRTPISAGIAGAFFKSMHRTLNHLLVTDRIWMRRFTGEGGAPDRLNAILFDAFAPLREAREAEDRCIVACVETLDESKLAGVIKYRRVSTPDEVVQPLWPALTHGSITKLTIADRLTPS